jgi:hypothetical protein
MGCRFAKHLNHSSPHAGIHGMTPISGFGLLGSVANLDPRGVEKHNRADRRAVGLSFDGIVLPHQWPWQVSKRQIAPASIFKSAARRVATRHDKRTFLAGVLIAAAVDLVAPIESRPNPKDIDIASTSGRDQVQLRSIGLRRDCLSQASACDANATSFNIYRSL